MRTLDASAPSFTALLSAAARAAHSLVDQPPHLLRDPDAAAVCALFDPSPLAYQLGAPQFPILAEARVSTTARSRFARQRVDAAKVDQLVLLGAGLDTSVSRDWPGRTFAVDRPDVLAWRGGLFTEADVNDPSVPVVADLTDAGLWDALIDAGLDPTRPAAVVALGLSMYLTDADNRAWLSTLSQLPTGSLVVLDTLAPDAEADQAGRDYAAAIIASAGGREPWHWRPGRGEVIEGLEASGWGSVTLTAQADAVPSAFWDANPGLVPQRLAQLIHAQVAPPTTL